MWWYLLGNLLGSILGGVIFKLNPKRIQAFASIKNQWYFVSNAKYVDAEDSLRSESLDEGQEHENSNSVGLELYPNMDSFNERFAANNGFLNRSQQNDRRVSSKFISSDNNPNPKFNFSNH